MLLSRSRTLLGFRCTIIWVDSIRRDRGQKKYICQCIFIKPIVWIEAWTFLSFKLPSSYINSSYINSSYINSSYINSS